MYGEEITEILKNTYSVCAHTLDFGSSAASRRKMDECFFTIWIKTIKKFLCSETYWNHSFLKLKRDV